MDSATATVNIDVTPVDDPPGGGGEGPAHIWIGLRNSDDQGTQFDVQLELLRDGVPVASGLTRCVTGLTRNQTFAKGIDVPWGNAPAQLDPGEYSVRVSTRIGTTRDGAKCPGPGGSHASAVGLRLYYDAPSRASHLAPFGGGTGLYLHSDGGGCDKPSATRESQGVTTRFLGTNAPTGNIVKCKDSGPLNFAKGNAFVTVGIWAYQPVG